MQCLTISRELGGRYWADPTGSSSVPGMGRSFFTGLTFEF